MRVPAIFHPHDPRSRYLHLLLWLIAYLLTGAIAEESGGKLWLMDALLLGVLVTTLRAVSRTPREFLAAVLVGGAGLAAALAAAVFPDPHLMIARSALGAAFAGFLSVIFLREVLRRGAVDGDTILGAVCAYLLVGICWAGIYATVEQLRPGSLTPPNAGAGQTPNAGAGQTPNAGAGPNFIGGAGLTPIGGAGHMTAGGAERLTAGRMDLFLYFSFVTLATLGYGDVLPAVPTTRTLAWMEAVFRQFYLAVLVARLVGLVQVRSAGDNDAGGRTGGGTRQRTGGSADGRTSGGEAGGAGRRAAP